MAYRALDSDKIEMTIETLQRRIDERFPGRGLSRLCGQLLAIAREDRQQLTYVTRPNYWIRSGVAVVIAIGAATMVYAVWKLARMTANDELFNAMQGMEALLNAIALSGAAVWFLLNAEQNIRRRFVLANLHELRSIAHVVDMHQLTKDPTTMSSDYTATTSSQQHNMTVFELVRYLDYCSEMLSLTGKLAALYMQNMRDPVVIQAVNEIEDLTGNLSRKVWQKIMILRQDAAEGWGR